jgi:hypothetical protein
MRDGTSWSARGDRVGDKEHARQEAAQDDSMRRCDHKISWLFAGQAQDVVVITLARARVPDSPKTRHWLVEHGERGREGATARTVENGYAIGLSV